MVYWLSGQCWRLFSGPSVVELPCQGHPNGRILVWSEKDKALMIRCLYAASAKAKFLP